MPVKHQKCPACGQLADTLPSGGWAVCAACGLEGCEGCIPGGYLRPPMEDPLCDDCDDDIADDLDDEDNEGWANS